MTQENVIYNQHKSDQNNPVATENKETPLNQLQVLWYPIALLLGGILGAEVVARVFKLKTHPAPQRGYSRSFKIIMLILLIIGVLIVFYAKREI